MGSWTARPILAWTIRAGLVVGPLIASWLSVRCAVRVVPRPDSSMRTIIWVAGAISLSTLVYHLLRRAMRRLSSLGVLYRLSLTFPDAAPSRLGAALRGGRIEGLSTGDDDAAAPRRRAQRLADLIASVARSEHVTRGHGDRVRAYSLLIGHEMGLAEADLNSLAWAALLHDVGKLDVTSRILDKRGLLDAEERRLVEQHPVAAIGYLEPFGGWLGEWARAATEHHERWDGTGYPAGLAGTDISRGGRIVAVADAYDAMTSAHSYRKPISPAAARQELVDNAGTQFDPEVVRAFLNSGIRESRTALGPMAALLELPARISSLAPAASASAGIAAAGTVAILASVVALPAVSATVEVAPPAVERVVEEQVPTSTVPETTSTTIKTKTTTTTTTTTTSTTSTTTTVAPTTTSRRRVTTTTTAPPPSTTAPPPPTTTAAPVGYPVTGPAPPSYPTVAP